MKLLRRPSLFRFLVLAFSFLILTACVPAVITTTTHTSTDPQPLAGYVLVTANPQPTATPFQPGAAATSRPTITAFPTLTHTSAPQATRRVELVETQTLQPTDPPASPPTNLPSDTPVPPAPPASADKPQYAISALLDYAGHIVTVSEVVLYPNRSTDALGNLAFAVNPNLWNGVFALQSLSVNDQPWSNYSLAGQWLTVNLETPLQPGQTIKIGLGYQLALPYSSSKYENFGYTARQTNLIDWYPFVPPYSTGSWILPDPYSYGENLVYEKADFRVSLTFADPANAPVVAASAPASIENGALVYNLPNARNFTLSASPEYLLNTADANGVTIYNYYYPEDASAAAMVLELTRLAVNTYSTEFGPYPHATLTVCETDLNDGLETDGLYFLARNFYRAYDGTVRNNLSVIAIHETAHQWWYAKVGSDQALEPWLDEAMATYTERIFYEHFYPQDISWWQEGRIDVFEPQGFINRPVADYRTYESYRNSVYLNGALFFEDLRARIGDDAFFAFLKDYANRFAYQRVTARDFFAVLQGHTDMDLTPLLDKYFDPAYLPSN